MPLSSAEKSRRYRERLKRERPEEYVAQHQRNLQRIKSNKKKIAEMSAAEAEAQRAKWRQEKRRSEAAKRNNSQKQELLPSSETIPHSSAIQKQNETLKFKCKTLLRKYRRSLTYIQKHKTKTECNKKKFQRLKNQFDQKTQEMQKTIDRMKAREEILEIALKKTYTESNTQCEKRVLKKLVNNSENRAYVSKLLGLRGKARVMKKRVRRVCIKQITDFFNRDDVSRNTAGKRQTRTKNKEKLQIRYLMDTLSNLYKKYRCEGGGYGFTTFFKTKPYNILSPGLNARDTCLCAKHSNIGYKHNVLKKHGLLEMNISDILKELVCDINNYTCMYGKCNQCIRKKIHYKDSTIYEDNLVVTWLQWVRVDHTYTKKEGNENKEVKTQKMDRLLKTGTLHDLKNIFDSDIQQFRKHYFNMKHQQEMYQKAIVELKPDEVVLVCDFSQNYQVKLDHEIQSMHFGASKAQISLQTGMIYWKDKTQSFCTISENTSHAPPAIWAHLKPLLKLITDETPHVKVIHYFSDGPTAQYRQKGNFYLLAYFTKIYQFKYCTWSYYEAGHGKNVADGIGGCVKRSLDRKVCQGFNVANAEEAYNVAKGCMKILKIFLIPHEDIIKMTELLPQNLQTLKGTIKLHQIITENSGNFKIKYRDVSCFCGDIRGCCSCFSPEIHSLLSEKTQKSTEIIRGVFGPVNIKKRRVADLSYNEPHLSADLKNTKLSPAKRPPNIVNVNKSVKTLKPAKDKRIIPSTMTTRNPLTEINKLEIFNNTDFASLESVIGKDFTESIDLNDIIDKPIILAPDNDSNSFVENSMAVKTMKNTSSNRAKILECSKCTCSILGQKAKCLVCKNLYCEDCVDGPIHFDFICDACFGD